MATVILVVVAVTMALVISYYAFNLVSSVTRFERLEVYGARMTDSRTIAFRVRNPGIEVSRLSALTV
jgi:NO-binding membrane sensor protein with MHYT domain